MSDNIQARHDSDAHADDAPPTDAVTDEVREDAASAEEHTFGNADAGPDTDTDTGSDADSPAGPNADADEQAAAQALGSEEQGDA
jgi:hypothetical protein